MHPTKIQIAIFAATDSADISLDEVEIDFSFSLGAVQARVDLDTGSPKTLPLTTLMVLSKHISHTQPTVVFP